MLLKGAVLAGAPFFEPGLRPIGDVDVLVEPDHARAATRILEESGWLAWRRHGERDLLLAHGLDLQKPPHGALDLHWYLLGGVLLGRRRPGSLAARAADDVGDTDDGRAVGGGPAASRLRARPAVESRARRTLGRRRRSDHSDERRAARLGCRRRRSGASTARPADDARPACGSRTRARRCAAGGDRDAGTAAASWRERLECRFKGRPVVERGRPVRDLDGVASKRGRRPEPPGSHRRPGRGSWQRRLASLHRLRSSGDFAAHAWTRARAVVQSCAAARGIDADADGRAPVIRSIQRATTKSSRSRCRL